MGRNQRPSSPVCLARVSGIASDTIERFGSDRLRTAVGQLLRVEGALNRNRKELVEHLYRVVPQAQPELRGLLLELKRAAFNGRSLALRIEEDLRPEVLAVGGSALERVLGLETKLVTAQASFEAVWRQEHDDQRCHLNRFVDDRDLERGIALASPTLAHQLRRLRGDRGTKTLSDRRRRKAEESLLRYVSRAALKLSPFSTFTRVGACELRQETARGGLELKGEPWGERSLLRLRRFSLNQIQAGLFRDPVVRDGCRVILNTTLEEVAADRFRFLRPGLWRLDEKGELCFDEDALLTVELRGPLVRELLQQLAEGPRIWDELLRVLAGPKADEARIGQVRAGLDQLLQLGFLVRVPPWPIQEGHLERRMAEELRSCGDTAAGRALERLVAAEEAFPSSEEPVWAVNELQRCHREARRAAGLPEGPRQNGNGPTNAGDFYEDVFLTAAGGSGAIAHLPFGVAEELLAAARPLLQLGHFFHPRHNLRLAVVAEMERRWPDRRDVAFLEAFEALRPLWKAFTRFERQWFEKGANHESFNPLEQASVAQLENRRARLRQRLDEATVRQDGHEHLSPQILGSLAAELPKEHRFPLGACLMLQPADAEGRCWVVNELLEGTGRWGSRFTPVMDEATRGRYLQRLLAAATVEDCEGGAAGSAEILDVLSVRGHTVNVHAIQTPRVLEIPGEASLLPPARRLHLGDLRLRRGEDGASLGISTRRGRRLLPVALGLHSHQLLPAPVRFLCLLGPGEPVAVLPRARQRMEGDVTVEDRLYLGPLVLRRRRWRTSIRVLREELRDLSAADAFLALQQWRLERGLPDRVFLSERVHHSTGGERFKPQYLDLTSPLFAELLVSSLKRCPEILCFEEALPEAAAYPRDDRGRRWAVEVLLDDLILRGSSRQTGDPRSFPARKGVSQPPRVAEDLPTEPIPAH